MHRVKATLPKLQPDDGIADQAHTTINVGRREVGMASSIGHRNPPGSNLASLPEQPQMNGGKGRKENPQVHRIFAYLKTRDCLNRVPGNVQDPAW